MRKPITDVLQFLKQNEDADIAYITASALNLHAEALKRLHGRSKFEIADVESLMAIVALLLGDRMVQRRAPVDGLEQKMQEVEDEYRSTP